MSVMHCSLLNMHHYEKTDERQIMEGLLHQLRAAEQEIQRFGAAYELAPDRYALRGAEIIAVLRQELEARERLLAERACLGPSEVSGRQMAIALRVAPSTVTRWLAAPTAIPPKGPGDEEF